MIEVAIIANPPRRKVSGSVRRDHFSEVRFEMLITLECGHVTKGSRRQARSKAIECWQCHHEQKLQANQEAKP